MDTVEFVVTVDQTGIPRAMARLEVDVSGDDKISDDEVVSLAGDGPKTWRGRKRVEKLNGTLFYLRIVAPKGTTWTIQATCNGGTVLDKSGKMKTTKVQVVGRLKVKS
jgi:hypothetical protein